MAYKQTIRLKAGEAGKEVKGRLKPRQRRQGHPPEDTKYQNRIDVIINRTAERSLINKK